MINKIIVGIIVQIISIKVLWFISSPEYPWILLSILLKLAVKFITITSNKYKTKIEINTKKTIISWCKSTMPYIIGLAGVWNATYLLWCVGNPIIGVNNMPHILLIGRFTAI
jgi:hypothetical protein